MEREGATMDDFFAEFRNVDPAFKAAVDARVVKPAVREILLDTTVRMRRLVGSMVADDDIADVAARAGVDETVVRDLKDRGHAPASATLRVLKTLKVWTPALPPECLDGRRETSR